MNENVYLKKNDSLILLNNQTFIGYHGDFYNGDEGAAGTNDIREEIKDVNGLCVYRSYYALNSPDTYGNILSIGYGPSTSEMSQLFLPWNPQETTPAPIYYRSHSDMPQSEGNVWTNWRRIAYYDEIKTICREILKSEGLIK